MCAQQLPDAFKDFAAEQTAGGKAPSNPLMTHCARDLMHQQWAVLLDDEFLEAWRHGIVITCCDGIKRRFYPRIFTYSADYPEKYISSFSRNEILLSILEQNSPCKYSQSGPLSLPPVPRAVIRGSQHRHGSGYAASSDAGPCR